MAEEEAAVAEGHGLADERQVLVIHHVPFLGVHIKGACTLFIWLLVHGGGEQDVGADDGVGRDAVLGRVAVLERVEAAAG